MSTLTKQTPVTSYDRELQGSAPILEIIIGLVMMVIIIAVTIPIFAVSSKVVNVAKVTTMHQKVSILMSTNEPNNIVAQEVTAFTVQNIGNPGAKFELTGFSPDDIVFVSISDEIYGAVDVQIKSKDNGKEFSSADVETLSPIDINNLTNDLSTTESKP